MYPQRLSLQQMFVLAFEGAWVARKRVGLRLLALIFVLILTVKLGHYGQGQYLNSYLFGIASLTL
jgi:hypothetical protein